MLGQPQKTSTNLGASVKMYSINQLLLVTRVSELLSFGYMGDG